MFFGLKWLLPAVLLSCVRPATPSKCEELEKLLHPNGATEMRKVTMNGKVIDVALYWGSDPARAASALLKALLTHGLLYSGVYLRQGNHSTSGLATFIDFKNNYYEYDTFVIAVSTAWDIHNKNQVSWLPWQGRSAGLAGPRLRNYGYSSVPARCRLHARLTFTARSRPSCYQHVHWTFYTNATALQNCDFFDINEMNSTLLIPVLVVGTCSMAVGLMQLEERQVGPETRLLVRPVDRAAIIQLLQTANGSFLFLDYDIWEGEQSVMKMEPPPCLNISCWQDLDSTVAMRIADVKLLEQYAPHVMKYAFNFNPDSKSLRDILEQEASGVQVEEAACEWILNNNEKVSNTSQYNSDTYWFTVYLCHEDPDVNVYKDIVEYFDKEINFNKGANYTLTIKYMTFNCLNPEDLYMKISKWFSYLDSNNMVGIVAQAGTGLSVLRAVHAAAALNTPLLLMGMAPTTTGAWRISGTSCHLALALQRFVHDCRWSRVAVLSEKEPLADDFYTALQVDAQFIHHNIRIPDNFTKVDATQLLSELQRVTARIIFINAGVEIAEVILSAALENRMRYEDGYVWILRDWQTNKAKLNMTFFSVSFWRRRNDISLKDTELLLHNYSRILPEEWPPLTTSLVDSMSIMAHGVYELFTKYPEMRQDLHTNLTSHTLQEEIFIKVPVAGLTQVHHLKERSIEETYVFVDKWHSTKYQRLATWLVNASNKTVRGQFTPPNDLPWYDGADTCNIKTGDSFEPTCHDNLLMFTLALLLFGAVGLILLRLWLRWRISKLITERESRVRMKQIANRQHVANVLFSYLVRRETLELLEEIGAGSFGCVYLALFRSSSTGIRTVAAKGLREDAAPAEESEFLHEACVIASLDHKHIIRLVAVSIDNGPPLVIMELAVFGDLLQYLRTRRHLVEEQMAPNETGIEGISCDEAVHVSSEALTRLAREAATALAYLTTRGIVHCDVRAANCLIDSRRSLKLADFGMARETRVGTNGTAEYACQRRGLFPVLWMAPESLKYGVFSSASDVWALGVLLVELVTLGARPYGTMSPLHVRQYVEAGGYPPLPLDASPHMRNVARQCWRRAAEHRPTSQDVAAFLATHPRSLSPALLAAIDIPEPRLSRDSTAESGLGESPPSSPLEALESMQVVLDCQGLSNHSNTTEPTES